MSRGEGDQVIWFAWDFPGFCIESPASLEIPQPLANWDDWPPGLSEFSRSFTASEDARFAVASGARGLKTLLL